MRSCGILTDPRFLEHETGPGHPERPTRLDALVGGLNENELLAKAQVFRGVDVSDDVLLRIHTAGYLKRLQGACDRGEPFIDTPDSAIGPTSWEIARLAAGGVVETTRAVASGNLQRAFCAVRPPGHHAETGQSMGFCLFNNIALAARTLIDEFGMQRVMVLDWDVHHGNGTQHIFETDPRVLFISLHGHPRFLYPGTGFEYETGRGEGAGYTVNIPFPPGARDDDYEAAFNEIIEPAAERYEPQCLLISCGFDAHAHDPLGNLELSDDAFIWMTRRAVAIARHTAEGRIVSVLEGGYNLEVMRRCGAAHVRELMEL